MVSSPCTTLAGMTARLIAVAVSDPESSYYQEVADLPRPCPVMLRRFFQYYKQLEGKVGEVDETEPASSCSKVIQDCVQRYRETYGNSPVAA